MSIKETTMATIEIPDADPRGSYYSEPFTFPPELHGREMLLTLEDDADEHGEEACRTPVVVNLVADGSRVYITLGPEGGDDPGIMIEYFGGNLQTFSWDGEQLGDDGTKRILARIAE
jgi:hypothetical protein